MLVVIANDLPPAVRGRMKLWFTEARPNIFVSGVKDSVAKSVVDYLYKHCPLEAGLLVFQQISYSPGYKIIGIGNSKRKLSELSGFPVVIEKSQ